MPFSPDIANSLHVDGFCKQSNMRFLRGGAGKSDTSGIFLIGAAHTAMKRRYLLSETDRNLSASIVSFCPVKRDAENAQQAPHVMHGLGLFIIHRYSDKS